MTMPYKSPDSEIDALMHARGKTYIRLKPHGPSYLVLSVGSGWLKLESVEVSDLADSNMPFWINLAHVETISIRSDP